MHPKAKNILKALIVVVLTPIVMFLVLTVMLYLPPVQNWAAHKVASYASEQTGDSITVGRVALSFPLDLEVSDFRMLHPNDSIKDVTDTIADVGTLVASVQMLPLLHGTVNVDELTFKHLKANTSNFIGDLRIQGNLEKLHVHCHGIDLKEDSAKVDFAEIESGGLDIALGDTVPPDTTKKTLWTILLGKVSIKNTALKIHMPGDTMSVRADFHYAVGNNAELRLRDKIYKVASFDWHGGALAYDRNYEPHALKGFDASHIAARNVNIGLDSFSYNRPVIAFKVRAANFKEHSGLTVSGLSTAFLLDNRQLRLSDMHLIMPSTDVKGKFWMDMDAFAIKSPGKFFADVNGYIGAGDLSPFLTSVPSNYLTSLPHEPLDIRGRFYGNLDYLSFRNVVMGFPSAFTFKGNGYVAHLRNTDNLMFSSRLDLTTRDMSFAKHFMPSSARKAIGIPEGLNINGLFKLDHKVVEADFKAALDQGVLKAKGFFDRRRENYDITADARAFDLGRIVLGQKAGVITGRVSAHGHGTDIPSEASSIAAEIRLDKFRMRGYNLDNIKATVRMSHGRIDTRLNSRNAMAYGNIHLNGRLTKNLLDADVEGRIASANLKTLGITDKAWTVSVKPKVHVSSNLNDSYTIRGNIDDLWLHERKLARSRLLASSRHLFVDGTLRGTALAARIKGVVDEANLQGLGITGKQYVVATTASADVKANLRKPYSIFGTVDAQSFNMVERRAKVTVPLVSGNFTAKADVKGKNVAGSFDGMISEADLYQLGIVDEPFKTKGKARLNLSTNMKDRYLVDGRIDDMVISDGNGNYTTSNLTVSLLSTADTTHASVIGGDFTLKADAQGSYKTFLSGITRLTDMLQKQIKDKEIDQPALKAKLPVAHLVMNTGKGNILSNILAKNGIIFKYADVDITSSPMDGLNGSAVVDSFVYKDYTVDSLNLALKSEDSKLRYKLAVLNNAQNSYPYRGFVDGTFFEKGALANVRILDTNNKTALDLGLRAAMHGDGIMSSITSGHPILGYKEFGVNDSNYVYIGRDSRVSADVKLQANDGAGAEIYTDDADTTSLQNITLGMHNFELGKLLTVLPFAPKISGTLNGDYHFVQTTNDVTVASYMSVKNMVYDDCPMGDVGTNFVYIPKGDGTHFVDAMITKDDNEVGQFTGTYDSKGSGNLDATLTMDQFPLNYINGFVPDRIIGLNGTGEGTLSVRGPLDNLDINGEILLDSAHIFSEPYGVSMRFDNDPVTIKDSRLLFENFEMYANNDQPLDVVGYLDFHDPSNMYLDTRMKADNFKLIDSKENVRSTIYGEAYVNFLGGMRGYLNNLRMGGRLEVLGNTDMTYVMRDTPLSTEDTPDDLIKFTNFNDTIKDVVVRPSINGLQIDLGIDIDEQAHVVAALNSQHSNYIDLIGGGSLMMHYDPTNDLSLQGRYTLNSGQMKYSLDVIPLRTFNIQEGSYIEFTGEPMNPTLNITATDRVRANYSSSGGNDRLVNFTAGVKLTNTLSSPGIQFIVEAPDDAEAQNDLNTKSEEEKGKIAVTLLASGMYMANGAKANYAMSSALASFMQNQINTVTGRALSSMGLDLSANMESSADASGALHTDYTFNFSKRLLNNRLRIMIGGRVSTGSSAGGGNGAYFDNFSLEYRLNQRETQYLKLYYERQAYDWLEGDVSEFGGGFMWRRKLQHFKDIIKFRSSSPKTPAKPSESKDTLIRFNKR